MVSHIDMLALALYVCRCTYGVDFGCCFTCEGNAKALVRGTATEQVPRFFCVINIKEYYCSNIHEALQTDIVRTESFGL